MPGLNLLAAIIIYWNTKHRGQAITARNRARLWTGSVDGVPPTFLLEVR